MLVGISKTFFLYGSVGHLCLKLKNVCQYRNFESCFGQDEFRQKVIFTSLFATC